MAEWLERRHLSHPLLSLIPLLLAAALGGAWYGAVFAVAFYYGREVAHVGAYWSDNPWWWGFDLRRWRRDNHLDFWPVLGVTLPGAYLLETYT